MSTVSNIILGIGNIGQQYEGTRHNIGFDVIEALFSLGTDVTPQKLQFASAAEVTLGGARVLLMKPTTYVNHSGYAASEALNLYNLAPENLLVIVDDFHIDLGSLRFRRKGSAGGHNGLASIIEECSNTFHRLRFGIGPLPEKSDIIDFVLGRFQQSEIAVAQESVGKAVVAINSYIELGLDTAMNQHNS